MTRARFYGPHLVALALLAVALGWAFHVTRIDLLLATPWYDPINHTFPWRYAWITKYAIHRHLKVLQIAFGLVMCVVAWRASRASSIFLATHRLRLRCIAISFVAVPATIAVIHRLSPMHCPWHVAEFGGNAQYADLLSSSLASVAPGHCFPAMFVTTGAWMLSFALLWFPENRRRSVLVGIATLAWAFGLGWVQQMRGAHFLSHTLWSLWVSWSVVLFVHQACGAWREGSRNAIVTPRVEGTRVDRLHGRLGGRFPARVDSGVRD